MDINTEVKLEISYGLGIVKVFDCVNKKQYNQYFYQSKTPFIYLWLSKRAEKRAIKKAMSFIGKQIFERHQQMQS